MLSVNKHQTKAGLLVELSGAIEENVLFEQVIGPIQGVLTVNCRGVTRINSVGVKTWIRYFQSLKQQGQIFKFADCSYPIIEQLNMISNFSCGGEIESVLLPFSCIKCNKEFVAACSTIELKANGLKIPEVKCEQEACGAQFDDDPSEYLYFLED